MRYTASADRSRFDISGSITEESDFAPLLEALPAKCVLDLSNVKRINSTGVRKWIQFMRAVPAVQSVRLEKCPVLFVSQMNMIAGFAGHATVASVSVPLICTACEEPAEEVVELDGFSPEAFTTTSVCSACGGKLALDAEPLDYFAFLSS